VATLFYKTLLYKGVPKAFFRVVIKILNIFHETYHILNSNFN